MDKRVQSLTLQVLLSLLGVTLVAAQAATVATATAGLGSVTTSLPSTLNLTQVSCVVLDPTPSYVIPPIALSAFKKAGSFNPTSCAGVCVNPSTNHTGFYAAPFYAKGLVNGTKCICTSPIATRIQVNASVGSCNWGCSGSFCGGFDSVANRVAWSLYGQPESDADLPSPSSTVLPSPTVIQPTITTTTGFLSTSSQPPLTTVTVVPVTDSNGNVETFTNSVGSVVVVMRTVIVTIPPSPRPPGPIVSTSINPNQGVPTGGLDPSVLGSLVGVGAVCFVAFAAIALVNRKKDTKEGEIEDVVDGSAGGPGVPNGSEPMTSSQNSRNQQQSTSMLGKGLDLEMPPLVGLVPTDGSDVSPHTMESAYDSDDGFSLNEPFRYVTPEADDSIVPIGKVSQDIQRKFFEPVTSGAAFTGTERSIQFSPRNGGTSKSIGTGRNESTVSNMASSVVLGAMPSSLKNDLTLDEHGSIFVGFQNFQQSWFDDPNILRATTAAAAASGAPGFGGLSSQVPVGRRRVTTALNAESIRDIRRRASRSSSTAGPRSPSILLRQNSRRTRSPSDDGSDSIISYLSSEADASSDVFVNTGVETQPNKKRRNASSVYMNLLADNE
ncbi:UNVERIFIED_CONTAM: hypothetical protein HDU68_011453 [Siphonaria sp. JEL0065]|nr:hypothetical protein HDU68_011453 [Siphonaria sp. JEL0065]